MSPLEFELLSLDNKAEELFTQGQLAAETTDYYSHKILLYSLHTFWVEVHYHREDNFIDAIQLAGPDDMKKYLNQIKIDTF